MKTIPITTITFDQRFNAAKMKKLRGAIIENVMENKSVFDAAEIPTAVFHNHKEIALGADNDSLPKGAGRNYHYPYIQYQQRHGRAGIMGIGIGAEAVQLWSSIAADHLTVAGRHFSLEVYQHHHEQWTPAVTEEINVYRLNKWMPFNTENLNLWKNTPRLTDKAKILDKLLWGHHFHLAQGLGFEIDKEHFELYVNTIDHQCWSDCYGVKKLSLDITFSTNLNIPGEIGLGQGTTIGYGKVQNISNKQSKAKRKVSFRNATNIISK